MCCAQREEKLTHVIILNAGNAKWNSCVVKLNKNRRLTSDFWENPIL